MNTSRSTYQVHAEVQSTSAALSGLAAVEAGRALERRLNRIERVAAAYLGKIDRRSRNGLQIAFETADAALLGTCEMQHRCAVLPQVAGHRLAVRIGIHQGIVRQRAKDDEDNASDARQIASQLAVADDGIVASGVVVAALNPELRKFAHPLADLPAGMAAHRVDWRGEIPATPFGAESAWPASRAAAPADPYLLLRYGLKTVELTRDKPVALIGREPLSDLSVVGDHVSRNHCRIERRDDCIVLTDTSTNGTCVLPDEGPELMLKNGSIALKGQGLLFFGRPCNGERRGGVRYEAY